MGRQAGRRTTAACIRVCAPRAACAYAWESARCLPYQPLTKRALLPTPTAATAPQETGTSFSAALAGGVAGLVLAAQNYSGVENGIDMRDVKDAIVDGADVLPQLTATLPDGQLQIREGRRLNAYNTLSEYFGESVFPRLPPERAGKKPQPPPPPPRPPPPQVGAEA